MYLSVTVGDVCVYEAISSMPACVLETSTTQSCNGNSKKLFQIMRAAVSIAARCCSCVSEFLFCFFEVSFASCKSKYFNVYRIWIYFKRLCWYTFYRVTGLSSINQKLYILPVLTLMEKIFYCHVFLFLTGLLQYLLYEYLVERSLVVSHSGSPVSITIY